MIFAYMTSTPLRHRKSTKAQLKWRRQAPSTKGTRAPRIQDLVGRVGACRASLPNNASFVDFLVVRESGGLSLFVKLRGVDRGLGGWAGIFSGCFKTPGGVGLRVSGRAGLT